MNLQEILPRKMQPLHVLYFFLTYSPILWLVLFISFAMRATIKLGHLPIPSINDPKDLDFDIHHNLIWFLAVGIFSVLIPIWIFFTIFINKKEKHAINLKRYIFSFSAGIVLLLSFIYFDPYYLLEWFAD